MTGYGNAHAALTSPVAPWTRCAALRCMEPAHIYLDDAVPLCPAHVYGVRDHLARLDIYLPARPKQVQPRPGPDRPHVVYYGRTPTGLVKVGSTAAPGRRWQRLRVQYGGLDVLAAEPGGSDVEYARHAEYVALREGVTELFRHEGALRDRVAALAAGPWRDAVRAAHDASSYRGALRYS